ncbi:glutamate--cysteine ligase [Streptomyces sp. NPDC101132]|uniref:carboxylate-amine ligase n=1 Tax=Streptomyces sp. NPDC101132 TaxID=3366110 RepID=UPI00382B33AD
MLTIGVEEEYVLLDASGMPVPRADVVMAEAGLEPSVEGAELQHELLQCQIEVATPVCTQLAEAAGHLLRLRRALGQAAEDHDCRLASCGTPPRNPRSPDVTDAPRYRDLSVRAPQLVAEQLVCGTHVHVAVPSRDVGVAVLNRIRPWLPVLVAAAANSPLWNGRETGFASWRTVVFGRWPVSGPPPLFADAADYDRRARDLLAAGVARDTGQLYWQARLSDRYPTIEVRCADAQLCVHDTVMLAGLVRGLVGRAIADHDAGRPVPHWPPELIQAANWHAARYGLTHTLLSPHGSARPARAVVRELLDHTAPELERSGDLREVGRLVERLLERGTAAERQLRAHREGGLAGLLELLTADADSAP